MSVFIGTVKVVMDDKGVVQTQVQIREDAPDEVRHVIEIHAASLAATINKLAEDK